MEEEPRFPKPLEAFVIIIASFFFVFVITELLVLLFIPNIEEIEKNSVALKMLITVGELGLVILPLTYVRSRGLSFRQVFRWKPVPPIVWGLGLILGASISIIGDELDRLIHFIIPAPEWLGEISYALQIHNSLDFFLLVGGMVIIAALVEESIIRGFLQISLEKYQDVTRAVIYASLAWTIIHGMLYWAIQIFLIGIILGFIAWRSDSIIPSAIAHAVNNSIALLFYNINEEQLHGIYLWGEHVSPIFLILALIGLWWGIRMFYRVYPSSNSRFTP